jgi:nucleoside phosphorylase
MEPLFVAAHSSELAGIPGEILGVGAVEAALGAARVLAARTPECLILLGSCGAYASAGLSIGEVVVARRAVLACPAVAEQRAAFPDPIPRRAPSTNHTTRVLTPRGLREVTVATTLGITIDDALAASLARETGADVENLEAFAVARACELAEVSFAAILGVTNRVGARGRDEWRAHRAEIAERVCAIARLLRSPTTPRSPE